MENILKRLGSIIVSVEVSLYDCKNSSNLSNIKNNNKLKNIYTTRCNLPSSNHIQQYNFFKPPWIKKINKRITFNHFEFIKHTQLFRKDIDKIITINVQNNFSTYINNVYELLLNHYYIIILNCWCYEEILFIIDELKKNNIND